MIRWCSSCGPLSRAIEQAIIELSPQERKRLQRQIDELDGGRT